MAEITTTSKVKVLLIQETLMHYRQYIYQLMNEKVDLTLAYSKANQITDKSLKVIQLTHWSVGSLIFHKNLNKLFNNYDVVIILPHLRFIRLNLIPFFKHKYKLIAWSIGLHVSYDVHFRLDQKPNLKNRIFGLIHKKCDAIALYMPQTVDYYIKHYGFKKEECFVAYNTVKVEDFSELPPFSERNIFLFVGSLYKQKGLGELLQSYYDAKTRVSGLPKLYIVGGGDEKDIVQNSIIELGLDEDVILTGPIYDETVLADYFRRALLCISPRQAGLTVLKSLGYGVPFVAHEDAITGGEILNVLNGFNGFLYKDSRELVDIICNCTLHPEKVNEMSKNARTSYLEKATPEIMAQGVLDAIEYVMKH